jgi:hypothetical protein
MQRLLSVLVSVVWAAWFGGLLTLFLAVTSIFKTFGPDRHGAGNVAAGLFQMFERYQLGLAAAALVLTVVWSIFGGTSWRKHLLFVGFTIPTLLAAYSTIQVTPEIDRLRQLGATTGPEFARLHGLSSSLYLGEAIVLMVLAFLLVTIIARDGVAMPSKKKS